MLAHFQTPMRLLHRLLKVRRDVAKLLLLSETEGICDMLIQIALILFKRQHIIALLLNDLGSNGSLRSHRINGDDASFQHEQVEEVRKSCDLIGFLVNGHLSQHQSRFTGPGTDQMQGLLAPASIMRTSQGFAINGDYPADLLMQALHRARESTAQIAAHPGAQRRGQRYHETECHWAVLKRFSTTLLGL